MSLKNIDLFVKYLEPVYAYYLKDRSADVRQLGLQKLPELIATYKIDWAMNSFYPRVIDTLQKENGYVIKRYNQ